MADKNSKAYLEGFDVGLRPHSGVGENPYARFYPFKEQESREWIVGWIDGSEKFIHDHKLMEQRT